MDNRTTVPQPEENNWELMLQQFAEKIPPHILGTRVARLLQCLLPAEDDPLLCHIIQGYTQSEPETALRWKIFEMAGDSGFTTPAGTLGLSLFWSHGSMSPEGVDPVYPDPDLSPLMLQCALTHCALLLADSPVQGTLQLLNHPIMNGSR